MNQRAFEFYKRYDNEFAMLQATVAQELKPGWYYSKGWVIIKINSLEVDNNGNLWDCEVWRIKGNINSRNLTKPTWIKNHAKKLDFNKFDKCPLCNGRGKVVDIHYLEPGPDFATDYDYDKCDFCEVFESIKRQK